MRAHTDEVSPRRRGHRERGLSLIEVLVSMGILAFVAMGVTTLMILSLHQGKMAKERSTATALAADRIDQITSRPYASQAEYTRYQLPEETAAAGPPPTLTTGVGAIPGYPDFSRVVTLRYDTPYAGMLAIECTVTWQHVGKGSKSHTMITYVHPGLD